MRDEGVRTGLHRWSVAPPSGVTHLRRSTARWPHLAAQAAVVAISVMSAQLIVGVATDISGDLVAASFTSGPARSLAVRFETALSSEARSQSEAAESAVASVTGDLPLRLERTVVGALDDGPTLLVDPHLARNATTTAGRWAQGADEGVLQADAAAALDIAVGDTILVGDRRVQVSGLWRADDPTDPRWFADPGPLSGTEGGLAGPLVVQEEALATVTGALEARWTMTVVEPGAADLAGLARALDTLPDALDAADGLERTYLTMSGDLATTVERAGNRLDAAGRFVLVPLALLVSVAITALVRVTGLLWASRRPETVLLRSRGARQAGLIAIAAVEATGVVGLGASIGSVIRFDPIVFAAAAVVGLIVCCTGAALGVRDARPTSARTARRVGRLATAGGTVAALVAAGVSLSQYLLYSGTAGANPFGAIAPALGALALGLVALLALGPLFILVERLAARRPALAPSFVARHVARDAGVHATSVLLVVLVLAGGALSGAFALVAADAETEADRARVGTDVRVGLTLPPSIDESREGVRPADYGAEAGLAIVREARVGDEVVPLVARGGATIAVPTRGGSVVTTTIRAEGASGRLEPSLWITGADAQLRRLDADGVAMPTAPAGATVEFTMPPGDWMVLAVEARALGIDRASTAVVTIEEVTIAGAAVDTDPATLELTVRRPTGRVVLGAVPELMDVTLARATAERFGLSVGDTLTIGIPSTGSTIEAVVADVVPIVPGAGGAAGIGADLLTLERYVLDAGQRVPQPNQVWITTDDPDAAAARAATVSPVPATIDRIDDGARLAEATSGILLIGSTGTVALTLIAVATVWSSLARQRQEATGALVALGLPSREGARLRAAEFAAVLAAAVASGAVAGVVIAIVYLPALLTEVIR